MREPRDRPTIVGMAAEEPLPPRRSSVGLVVAALTVIALLVVLGVGNRRPPTDRSSDELPAPEFSAEMTRMPDLAGADIDDVPALLTEAGFGEAPSLTLRWVANPRQPVGTVFRQDPQQDTVVHPDAGVSVAVSAGGPTVSLDELPDYLQALVGADFDPTEAILVIDTAAGPAYKTDALIFGPCDAIPLAARLSLDPDYDEACPSTESTSLTGWLLDGTAFIVEGLRPGRYEPTDLSGAVMVDLDDGTSQALGIPSYRHVPASAIGVVRAGNLLSVMGGRWHAQVALYEETLSLLSADQVSTLGRGIVPMELDGHLVVDLPAPLRFQAPNEVPDRIGVSYDGFQVAAGCIEIPNTVCDPTGSISVTFSEPPPSADVSITLIEAGEWSRHEGDGFAIGYPDSWTIASESLTPDLLSPAEVVSLGTFPLEPGGERCGHVPEQALRDLGPTDALISIQVEGSRARPKPHQFGEGTIPRLDGLTDAHVCSDRHDLDIRWQAFDIEGNGTRLLVAFGDEVPPSTKAAAWAILNSFEFGDAN